MLDYKKVMELNSQYEQIFTSERRWWVKPINQNRDQQGDYSHLLQEMIDYGDHEAFFNYTRMEVPQFNYLANLVRPFLVKQSFREPLPPELRLFVTLR